MPPQRCPGIALIVGVVIAAVSACGSSSSSSPTATSTGAGAGRIAVTIQNFAFSPPTVTVRFGTVVTWTNQDSTPHTATSDPGAPGTFDTGNIGHTNTAHFTLQTPGTYAYHCSIHPFMKGTINVTT